MPWLDAPLQRALKEQRSHALLVHGPNGVGQFEFALGLAQGWLCEAKGDAGTRRPCGHCASCHLVRARSHPDLLVLVPEALRAALGWESEEGDDSGDKASKAKPSKEIKVEAVRGAVAFAQSTSARGRGKAVVVHPAERMNGISANTLLKTLEEPPGNARFVLSSGAPDELLPTVRSRCLALPIDAPAEDVAVAWLEEQGVGDPAVLLAATGGQPQEALAWHRAGISAAAWLRLPTAMQQGDLGFVADWTPAQLIETLTKLCHDLLRVAVGTAPRYFPPNVVKAEPAAVSGLLEWQRELQRAARNSEHPWNAGLLAESLVSQGSTAMRVTAPRRAAQRAGSPIDSVHSRA